MTSNGHRHVLQCITEKHVYKNKHDRILRCSVKMHFFQLMYMKVALDNLPVLCIFSQIIESNCRI